MKVTDIANKLGVEGDLKLYVIYFCKERILDLAETKSLGRIVGLVDSEIPDAMKNSLTWKFLRHLVLAHGDSVFSKLSRDFDEDVKFLAKLLNVESISLMKEIDDFAKAYLKLHKVKLKVEC